MLYFRIVIDLFQENGENRRGNTDGTDFLTDRGEDKKTARRRFFYGY